MLKKLHAVLEQAAAGRGQSAEALLDHLLPDHGLDPAPLGLNLAGVTWCWLRTRAPRGRFAARLRRPTSADLG
jgi:hypothetical protein